MSGRDGSNQNMFTRFKITSAVLTVSHTLTSAEGDVRVTSLKSQSKHKTCDITYEVTDECEVSGDVRGIMQTQLYSLS